MTHANELLGSVARVRAYTLTRPSMRKAAPMASHKCKRPRHHSLWPPCSMGCGRMTEAVSRGRGLPAGIQILQLFGWRRSAPALEVHRGSSLEAHSGEFCSGRGTTGCGAGTGTALRSPASGRDHMQGPLQYRT